MLYFIVVIAISSVVVYGAGIAHGPKEYGQSHLTYMDALFLCTSAMSTTGMFCSRRPDVARLKKYRSQLCESWGPFWLPTSSIMHPDDTWKYPFCIRLGRAYTANTIPQENGRCCQAFAYYATPRAGY